MRNRTAGELRRFGRAVDVRGADQSGLRQIQDPEADSSAIAAEAACFEGTSVRRRRYLVSVLHASHGGFRRVCFHPDQLYRYFGAARTWICAVSTSLLNIHVLDATQTW